MEHLKDLLPKTWLEIGKKLKLLDLNYTHSGHYLDICKKQNINPSDAFILAEYFHDLGVILYFRSDPLLADTVILKPEWATQAVYTLIDTNEIILNQGSFEFKDLTRYWNPKLYPVSIHPQIIRLMEKFELCFNFTGTNTYFIPELLPGKPIEFDQTQYTAPGTLHFQYRYEFMPEGILSRFISRLYYLIHENRFWKFGVELIFDHTTARILSEPDFKRIQIDISGSNRSELLAIIRSHFAHIHQTLNMVSGSHYTEMLPCSCSTCSHEENPESKHYFDYQSLMRFIEKNKKIVQCPISTEDVEIRSLLTGFVRIDEHETILKAIIEAAYHVQGLSNAMKPDEDSRTGLLCLLLNEKGFFVKDQARWGFSETMKTMGRLDAFIETEKGGKGTRAVLEAFSLTGWNTGVITSHCQKIFKYDPSGLENNYIIVYCDVKGNRFSKLWDEYKKFVPGIEYESTQVKSFKEESSGYGEIKVMRVVHDRQGKGVGIYHLFIHMEIGKGTGKKEV